MYGKQEKKNRNIKLVTTKRRRSYLVSEPSYHTTKFYTENLLSIEMKKTDIYTRKPVFLELSILVLIKILKDDYMKPKWGEKANPNTDIFIVYIIVYFYRDITEDAKTRFGASNYGLDRPLPKGKNKKVIGLMKDELVEGIMTKRFGLRAKT